MKKTVLFLIIYILIAANSVFASKNTLFIINKNQVYDLSPLVDCFVDDHKNIEFSDILTMKYQSKFEGNLDNIPDLDMDDATVWCKFIIENRSEENVILKIENPTLDTIELFILNDDGFLIHHEETGSYLPVELRNIKSGNFLLDLHAKPGDRRVCYLRLKSGASGMYFPMQVASLKRFYEDRHTNSLGQGLYFGIIIFLVIYNIFLFITIRDISYFYFSLFAACIGLLFALIKGFGAEYVWQEWPWMNQYTGMLAALSGIFAIMFTASFLKSRIRTPKKHIWLLSLIGIYMFTIILNLAGFYYVSMKIIEYNSLFSLVFLVLVALSVWRDGFKPAKYYLFAWSFFVLGMIIFQSVKLELIPENYFTENILQISSTATIFFMAFAMAKKINIYIEKRDEAMQLALQTSLQNEKLIARQNKLLESRVTERTKDLEQTIDTLKRQQKELGDANKFKDKIFSVISHDLKSPLSTLSGLLDLLRIKSLNEYEKEKILDNLELALENTRELLDDILSWVIKKQDTNSKHTDINVYDLVEDIFKLFNFQATSKKIEMVNKAEKDVLIYWDKNTLQTVLRNLVSNAIKFSPIYGKVEISMQTTSGEVIIKVKDNGVGIPIEIQEKILNENEYYSTRGTKNEKGTGLGLILCKEFLNKNSAHITIDSFPGEGSSFIIHISTTKSVRLMESSAIA